jgi:catalase
MVWGHDEQPDVTRPTTDNIGIPVASDDDSLTLGTNGPILLQDRYLIEKNAQVDRERVPERVVHAKGGGAFGFLELTEDVSRFTEAAVLQPGTRTDSAVRFSTVAGELDTPHTWRNVDKAIGDKVAGAFDG